MLVMHLSNIPGYRAESRVFHNDVCGYPLVWPRPRSTCMGLLPVGRRLAP